MFFSNSFQINIAARKAAHNTMVNASNLEEWTVAYKMYRANGGVL